MLRLISATLYGTPALDLVVYGEVAVIFLVVALAASYLPARRAMGIDPATALRVT
jgi:putative ABC transport system permease protein